MNRSLLDYAPTVMMGTNFKKYLWNESILEAVYLLNRRPIHALNMEKTPAEP